jgi:hypothetical protein
MNKLGTSSLDSHILGSVDRRFSYSCAQIQPTELEKSTFNFPCSFRVDLRMCMHTTYENICGPIRCERRKEAFNSFCVKMSSLSD